MNAAQIPLVARFAPMRLLAARTFVLLVSGLTVGTFLVSAVIRFARLITPCSTQLACSERGGLTSAQIQALPHHALAVPLYAASVVGVEVLFVAATVVVGLIIFCERSSDSGGLFAALFMMTGAQATDTYDTVTLVYPEWTLVASVLGTFGFLIFIVMFYVFPTGRFEPPWTRWVAAGLASYFALLTLLSLSTASGPAFDGLFGVVVILAFASGIFAQAYRYRRLSSSVERQQTKWVIFGLSAGGLLCLLGKLATPLLHLNGPVWIILSDTLVSLALMLIPLSVLMAMMRYRLWDIDVIINRTLVYGTLTALVVGLYVLIAAGLGALLPTRNFLVSLGATGFVAVIFSPLRDRLQRTVNRLLYGDRDDPYRVLSRLGERLEAGLTPGAVLGNIVDTLSQSLRLPYAAIALAREEGPAVVTARGRPSGVDVRLPLVYQGRAVGEMILSPRARGEDFTPADLRLLHDLARHVGVAAHAVQLTADLQRSREGLVLAREEERRRLRRDLHDDLAPTLASLALSASAAADLIPVEPATAIELVRELETEIRSAVGDIRQLVYDLRPPALDELGLVGAVRQRVMQLARADGPRIRVEAPDALPSLPAAVEVAAYRIVQEALNNVVRHSQARTCTVSITLGDALEVEVADDGVGLPEERHSGVGLRSMRERAEELGGTCTVESSTGTRVRATLPLPGR